MGFYQYLLLIVLTTAGLQGRAGSADLRPSVAMDGDRERSWMTKSVSQISNACSH